MEYRKFDDTYVIRIDRGEEIITSLTDFCREEGVKLGSVQALGAAPEAGRQDPHQAAVAVI